MAARLRKSRKANLAESSSDDSDESDCKNTKKSSHKDIQKKKYCKTINNLCDTDSSNDSKASKEFYKSRLAASTRSNAGKKNCEVIDLSDSPDASDPSDSRTKMSTKNTKDKKRKRESASEESSSESAEKSTKVKKKMRSSNEKSSRHSNKNMSEESSSESAEKSTKVKKKLRSSNEKSSRHSNKNSSHIDDNDSSSSKEFQEPKSKKKNHLRNSLQRCDPNDYSTVNTPSRTDEEKIPVESAQEISFKHYVIQEIKKFQELNDKMQEDLQLNNEYLLKKKIKTVSDAKFFVHKILTIYDNTFSKFRKNRRDFVSTYDNWTDDLSKKPKEVGKKNRFSLSSDQSDDNIEATNDKKKSVNVTKNSSFSEKTKKDSNDQSDDNIEATNDKNKSVNVTKNGSFSEKAKKDSNESTMPDAAEIDRINRSAQIDPILASLPVGGNADQPPEMSSDDENKSPKKKRQSKLKLKADNNESVASKKAAEESDADSVIQASGCDSDAIFSSEESKSKRKSRTEKKTAQANETPSPKEKPVAPATEDADLQSSASEDLFDSTTGEVVDTPVKPAKKAPVPIDVDVIVETHNESDKIAEELAAKSSSDESNEEEPKVEDPKEREALRKLMADDDDSSDADADSEDEEEDDGAAAAKREAVRAKAKHLKKQTKKRNLCSDSSSSEDVKETTAGTKRRGGRSNDEATCMRMAPRQRSTAFILRSNRFYKADEKLRATCRVDVERLPESELARHARALKKSKDYVERKKIESLANLDNLESKSKSKAKSGDIETPESDEPDCAVKEPPKKSKPKKDEKMSVLDCFGKKGEDDVDESSDDQGNGEEPANSADPADVDEPMEQSVDEAENKAKEALLGASSGSSSSDDEAENETEANGDSKKQDAAKEKKSKKKKTDSGESDEDEDEDKKKEKSEWKNDKLLNFKLDGSETEEEKFHKSQEKKKSKESDTEKDKSPDESSSPVKGSKTVKKSRKKRRILDSDSDAQSGSGEENAQSSEPEESDEEKDEGDKKKKKKRRAQSSDSDTSSSGKKKSKRKRIKKVASDSESDDKDSPGKGRKNIRRVLKDKYVTDDTRKAAQDEEERLKRIADRQKLFHQMHEDRLANEEKVEKLVLDIDEETKEELVVVDEELAKRLKPHQARGIKFMWDACYESIEQVEKSDGSGCIIAHCMGLGKTFQVVTLAHTLLTHEKTGVRTVMIVCPLSTVLNWVNEFKIWLKHVKNSDEIEIFEMTKMKKNIERKVVLENWRNYGGVLIIGYEMFRNLTSTGKKMRKSMQESIMKSLVDPGADLVVCDEGHLLKNEDSALSKAMRLVKTMRRIVLTGTPLQNNLKEYHCMVQFVKPNLLGTKKEFLNRFVNPITNGQFDDSTPYDVKLMKKRAHVLHKMLEGSVQRFDYSVLTPFLPPKQEYVLFLRLTEKQIKLYQYYLDNMARRAGGRMSLFADFQALQRVWTHPYVLRLNAEKVEKADEKRRLEASDSEGSLKDFIDDDSTSASEASSRSSNSSDSDVECLDSDNEKAAATARKRGTRANPLAEDPEEQPVEETVKEAAWWSQFVDEEKDFNDLRISTKLMLLFAILKESEAMGDKVLVFSQSLYSLTLIEHFLNLMDDATQTGIDTEHLSGHTGTWVLGSDYFRLDGSTSAENRSIWSKIFNNPKNTRARLFLISTRAGGLGINLIGANRVIIFDASWNPSHDVQSIFRIYRFGQKKPCYVYRFLAAGTMEEKIYNRQVTKLSLACRVVDEQQIERHYSNTDLAELYQFDTCEESETLNLPKDRMLAEIFIKYKDFIVKCHEHDSLLENKEEEELDEEERKQAWMEYEEEKKGIRQQNFNNVGGNNYAFNQMLMNMNSMPEFQGVKQLLQKDYPDVPPEHLDVLTRQAMFDMYRMIDQQTVLNNMNNFRTQQAPATVQQQNNYGASTIQDAIMRQQSLLMNQAQPQAQAQPQPQPNYYGVNQMPVYSGRGRPPKYTSVNNQIVTNPMYMNAQAMHSQQQQLQQQQSVPSDNEVQVINEPSIEPSSNPAPSNAKN